MPTEKQIEPAIMQPLEGTRSEDALGQFSYVPATQTTVVTTTTTTTTKFPPLTIKAPQRLAELDPEQYPLAASPTPRFLKTVCFNLEGVPTYFREAEDTMGAVQQLQNQQKALAKSHGTLQSITRSDPEAETWDSDKNKNKRSNSFLRLRSPTSTPSIMRKRAASPVSISEAAVIAGQNGPRKRRVVSNEEIRPNVGISESSERKGSHSKLQIVQTSTPITPRIARGESVHGRKLPFWGSKISREDASKDLMSSKSSSSFDQQEEAEDEAQILSPRSEGNDNLDFGKGISENDPYEESADRSTWGNLGFGSTMTPRLESDGDTNSLHFRRPERPRPSALDTTAAQDVSLPSPSLSPVTAAANLQSRRGYFEQHHGGQIASHTEQPTLQVAPIANSRGRDDTSALGFGETPVDSQGTSSSESVLPQATSADWQLSTRSLMNMPSMVDAFEAMPEEMKQYLIYQYLRRCSKPVLHFVADVVNPALKCDFLRILPVELCLNILGNLDAKTLCSAAQVSKRWRRLIDSSEKIWQRLFDIDNFVLEAGELGKAVGWGWGWQYPSQLNESEQNLGGFSSNQSDTDISTGQVYGHSKTSPLLAPLNGNVVLQGKRSKRKAKSKLKHTSRKQQKRLASNSIGAPEFDEEGLLDMASTEGPYAIANAAAVVVPYPHVGLPSLKNFHLYKSIYARHHLIRKTWMQDEVAPHHIAFRAHQRHVVTCLQFDADKIITGSDDANINVYDTQKGALRAKLEGHEGGVWALEYEGNVLVSGSTDRTVRVWDIQKGVCTQVFQGHTSTVRCLQILKPTPVGKMPDGRNIMMPSQPLIITGSRDANLRVWKLPESGDATFFQNGPAPDESAECPYYVRTLTGHHHSVRAIDAHADTLVSGSYDCSVRVWKISTGETIHRLQGHGQKVYSVVLDIKRNRCISGSMDNLVKVWSLDTGSVLFNLEGHSSLVGLLDLRQDRLVSAAADSTLRIWDPENGQCKSTLKAHTGAITCFQHDGQKVISGSDRTLKMWNVGNGKFTKDLLTDLSGVWQVKFDERRCVAAVQRNNLTYIEVLDFGASRDGVAAHKRGKRIVVNAEGHEVADPHDTADPEVIAEE